MDTTPLQQQDPLRAAAMEATSNPDDFARVVGNLLQQFPARNFEVCLPNGTIFPSEPAGSPAQFSVMLKQPAGLRRMFLPPSELGLGESYIFDDYDIEGDMVAAFGFVEGLSWPDFSIGKALSLGRQLWGLGRNGRSQTDAPAAGNSAFHKYAGRGRQGTRERDLQAARFHYDLSNEFYKLWLDERLVYSCAYFADEGESLEAAQERKLDRICRKLRLKPGERLLDIGCGFGGLVIHAAGRYGVEATGISLSEAQTAEARVRIEAMGLSDRCRIEVVHYEEFTADHPFDKLASVGMFEHVGEARLPGYFSRAYDLLRPGGLFALQGGATRLDRPHAGRRWMDMLGLGRNAFMQKYSFPDTRVIDIPTVVRTAELTGFELRDIESLRAHYPLTIRHWLDRLENNREKIVCQVGEVAYRSWRVVLAGYIYLIEKGQLSAYQSLFAKPNTVGQVDLPLVRDP